MNQISFGCYLTAASFILVTFLTFSLEKEASGFTVQDTLSWNSEEVESWMSKMKKRMDERLQHLRNTCATIKNLGSSLKEKNSTQRSKLRAFLYNKKHHLLWCCVYKAASSSWVYNFNLLAGYSKAFLNEELPKRSPIHFAKIMYPTLLNSEFKQALNGSVKFIIVRHPFERLLAGYLGKLLEADILTPFQHLNIKIVQKYRGKKYVIKPREFPTFFEFVSYVIEEYENGGLLDDHWIPYSELCTPCQVNFDVIMKFETIDEDQSYFIHKEGLDRWVKPQWKNPSTHSKTSSLITKYYSNLTAIQISKLYTMYRFDFQLFNYYKF